MRRLVPALTILASLAVISALAAVSVSAAPSEVGSAAKKRDGDVATEVRNLDRSTPWELTDRIALDFPTYHPQGFALVGDTIFMSTVEIIEPTVRYPAPIDGYDRSPGKGVGHVLVLTRDGELLRDIVVGEGTIYHPGGIDFDGQDIWVPVAEYRPNSDAIVYTIDPDTYAVTEEFRYADHVGGVVRDQTTGKIHGVSWGSRTLFTWTRHGRLVERVANLNHFLDYQDCAYVERAKQLCTGVTGLPTATGGSYELGGLVLLDLRDNEILHEVPFQYFSAAGHVATRNPVAVEVDGDTIRLLAAPDDDGEVADTELLIYEAPRER
ncbi:MAG: hypothetical protein H0X54_03500 [Propionibacteriales bacterium]|jgi:hypothetical protein|nr:hypothetical protein [Propionibacteriales bacterium]